MLKWVTAHLGGLLLAALTCATLWPLVAAWWASREFTWATTLPIASIVALWFGFLNQHNASVRRIIGVTLAEFSRKEALISAQVQYRVGDNVNYARIAKIVQEHYSHAATASTVRTLETFGQMNVDAAGWRMRLVLSSPIASEWGEGEPEEGRDLLVTVPETFNNVPGAKRLVGNHILPLLNRIQKEPGVSLESAELRIRFMSGTNPYLSTYLQNLDVGSISRLECVLRPGNQGERVMLTTDAVTLTAPDLLTLGALANEHLGFYH